MVAIIGFYDWSTFKDYIAHTVVYIEPMFVVVIAYRFYRPIVKLAEQIMGRVKLLANLPLRLGGSQS